MNVKIEYKYINNKVKIPVLGLGTWRMGGGFLSRDYSQDSLYILAIKRAIEAGLTHIDTAEVYGGGHAEELVGKAIKSYKRQKLFITTKISPHHIFTSKQIFDHAYASLKRLCIEYIDLYLIHAPNPLVPLSRVMPNLDKLIEKGITRFIGVSNFSLKQLALAQKYSKFKIVTNQVHYNLLNRDPEKKLLSACIEKNILLTAYSPLSLGKLVSGRYKSLDYIAKKYGKTASQVAIRWLLDKPNVITIPKVTTKSHLEEVFGSLGWHLALKDQHYLEESLEFATNFNK